MDSLAAWGAQSTHVEQLIAVSGCFCCWFAHPAKTKVLVPMLHAPSKLAFVNPSPLRKTELPVGYVVQNRMGGHVQAGYAVANPRTNMERTRIWSVSEKMLVLSGECGNEPGNSLKGNHIWEVL